MQRKSEKPALPYVERGLTNDAYVVQRWADLGREGMGGKLAGTLGLFQRHRSAGRGVGVDSG